MARQASTFERQVNQRLWEEAVAKGKWPILGKSPEECPSLDKACMEAYEAVLVAEAKWLREEIKFLDRKSKSI